MSIFPVNLATCECFFFLVGDTLGNWGDILVNCKYNQQIEKKNSENWALWASFIKKKGHY